MRKITEQAATAFHAGRDFRSGNTKVNRRLGGVELVLHGNIIARDISGEGLEINLCGWNTNTTRERLCGLQGVSVSSKKKQAYLNGDPIPSNEWVKVTKRADFGEFKSEAAHSEAPYQWPNHDLKNLVMFAPMSPYTRTLLRIKFNDPVPDGATTFEQIEAWLAEVTA
jgi:N-acetyl-anhydromuramyl-L-alanine amidase AmpD